MLNTLNNIIQFLLNINLIWYNKFNCNFKYIYIKRIDFSTIFNCTIFILQKNRNKHGAGCERLTERKVLRSKRSLEKFQGVGMRQSNLPSHTGWGKDKVKQKTMWNKGENPILQPHPASLTSLPWWDCYKRHVLLRLIEIAFDFSLVYCLDAFLSFLFFYITTV